MPMEKSNLKPIVVKPQAGLGLVLWPIWGYYNELYQLIKAGQKNWILSFPNSVRFCPFLPASVAALLSLITGSYSVNIFLHI